VKEEETQPVPVALRFSHPSHRRRQRKDEIRPCTGALPRTSARGEHPVRASRLRLNGRFVLAALPGARIRAAHRPLAEFFWAV